jgi:hypothetical protein
LLVVKLTNADSTIAELCPLLGIEQELITPYSHEENGIVERMNKEVMRHLRDILFDKRSTEQWGKNCIPFVQRTLNSQEKKSTGVTPAELLFGSTVSLAKRCFAVNLLRMNLMVNLDVYRNTWTNCCLLRHFIES